MRRRKKMRPNRSTWLLDMIIKKGYHRGAEIGCKVGGNTYQLMKRSYGLVLYAVDLWGVVPEELQSDAYTYSDDDHEDIFRRFNKQLSPFIRKKKVIILRGLSWEMADLVEDGSLDFIFIDADHGYVSVIKDIRAWAPKLKEGGMATGHDICLEGVRKAVEELIPTYKEAKLDSIWYAEKEEVLL